MRQPLDDLRRSLAELVERSELVADVSDPSAWTDVLASEGEMIGLFEAQYGLRCPESQRIALLLPDTVTATWKANDKVSGELALSNHLLTLSRNLDPSFAEWTKKGVSLAETRIVDALVVHGGPIYVLILVSEVAISETLYVFDTRDLFELELTYEQYLGQLAVTKGAVYWQYLFCKDAVLSGFERAILTAEIDFLESSFPDWPYRDVRERLDDKGRRIILAR